MKKGIMIETAFTRINGGRPNTDLSVMREDISAALPAVVNYVNTGDYWANIQRDNDREIPNYYVAEEIVPVQGKDAIGRDYFPFDKVVMNLPANGGIRYVMDQCGNVYSPKVIGTNVKSYWDKALDYNKEFQYLDKKINVFGKPDMVDVMIVGYVADVSSLSDEDEVPLAPGTEAQALDMLVSFFTNQRMQPKDYINDGIDPVNKV